MKLSSSLLMMFLAATSFAAEDLIWKANASKVLPYSWLKKSVDNNMDVFTINGNQPTRMLEVKFPEINNLPKDTIAVFAADIAQENVSQLKQVFFGAKLIASQKRTNNKWYHPQSYGKSGSHDWIATEVPFKTKDVNTFLPTIAFERATGIVKFRNVRLISMKNYENYTVTGMTSNPGGVYKVGEEIKFNFKILNNQKPVAGKLFLTIKKDFAPTTTKILTVTSEKPAVYTDKLDKPGSIMVIANFITDQNAKGYRFGRAKDIRPIAYGLGAVCAPETFKQGAKEPADFDAFWLDQLTKLAKVPMTVLEKKQLPDKNGCLVYDMKIKCLGKRPASGYLTIPKNAKAKSLPIRMIYQGYSYEGAQTVTANPKEITFRVNAHGIPNGMPASYYAKLGNTELKGYGFDNKTNSDREKTYFNGMILRDLRALQYAKTLPQWNGKDIISDGGSQGGLQSIAISGLDKQVTFCTTQVPWFCDIGGVTIGRIRGWRPDYYPSLDYYDPVNFAKRSNAKFFIDAGLIDEVCPPTGVWILYNNIKHGKMVMHQGYNHRVYFGYVARTSGRTTLVK